MSKIHVEAIDRSGEPILQSLLQLYTHDFSEHWAGTRKGDLNALGRFPDYPLESYWTDAGHSALLLRIEDQLAGFALLNRDGHSGRPVDANIAEFFVVRKYRRGGVGTRFAHGLFKMRSGSWEAAVARKNVGALLFWRRVAQGYSGMADLEEVDVASADWNGPVLRFRIH